MSELKPNREQRRRAEKEVRRQEQKQADKLARLQKKVSQYLAYEAVKNINEKRERSDTEDGETE